MQPPDLAFFTTPELIEELMRRQTFLGVVVHSEQEFKGAAWGAERVFKVRFNAHLDAERVARLLDVIAAHLDNRAA
jgi:hypothetical protein